MLYAAYGSNMWDDQMLSRCPGAEYFATGQIIGYKLAFCRVATVVPQEASSTPVVIWKISAEDEKMLDRYEGYPHKYIKQQLPVKIDNETLSIMAYVMKDSSNISPPSDEYYSRIEEGYGLHGIDTAQLENAALDAYDALYYEEDPYDLQYSFFDDMYDSYDDFEDEYYSDIKMPNKENRDTMQSAFVIGSAFSEYDKYFSFSAGERAAVIDSIILNYELENNGLSLYAYSSHYFSELAQHCKEGGDIMQFVRGSSKRLYVAYGTNMNAEEMRVRCPNSRCLGAADIRDHELCFKGCADCTPKKGASAPALLWEIDLKDWKTLDTYEGYPSLYTRKHVIVDHRSNGKAYDAIMYCMTASHDTLFPPAESMYKRIEAGYKHYGIDTKPLEKAAAVSKAAERKMNNGTHNKR